jgi:hypothetical protein
LGLKNIHSAINRSHAMRNHLKLFLLLMAALAIPPLTIVSPGHAQDFKLEHLTDAQEPSQNAVFYILQVRQCFMWFGAQDGLNHYDGYGFTIFRYDPQDTNLKFAMQIPWQHENLSLRASFC